MSDPLTGFWLIFWWAVAQAVIGFVIGDRLRGRAALGGTLGLFLGVVGWAIILLFEDRRRKCPACRTVVDPKAIICRACGAALGSPQ